MVSTHWQHVEHHSVGFSSFNISISEHLLNANPENSNNLYKPGETIQDQKVSLYSVPSAGSENSQRKHLLLPSPGQQSRCCDVVQRKS